ncbi:unnamed protein product [Ectocarpus fasciculatus]
MCRDVPRHRRRGLEGLERVYRDLPKSHHCSAVDHPPVGDPDVTHPGAPLHLGGRQLLQLHRLWWRRSAGLPELGQPLRATAARPFVHGLLAVLHGAEQSPREQPRSDGVGGDPAVADLRRRSLGRSRRHRHRDAANVRQRDEDNPCQVLPRRHVARHGRNVYPAVLLRGGRAGHLGGRRSEPKLQVPKVRAQHDGDLRVRPQVASRRGSLLLRPVRRGRGELFFV